ncbi:IclR family transcriptional regulator [Streptomyces sp. enrichment culture]
MRPGLAHGRILSRWTARQHPPARYRRLASGGRSQHHPIKLSSSGTPPHRVRARPRECPVAAHALCRIHFSAVRNRPHYSINSVDHALHLAIVLQQEGPLRVSDAATRLGVSVSTAHRLLAMLVYRGFAEQRPDRRYQPGDVLRPAVTTQAPVAILRHVALPHLQRLTELVHESANLVVLAGTEIRFIATAESNQVLRVDSRVGVALPSHLASGGKALLAALPSHEVTALYSGLDVDFPKLRRELALIRKRGFAINDQRTEAGLSALAVPVRGPDGAPVAAISLAMPSVRFSRDRIADWVGALTATAAAITRAL